MASTIISATIDGTYPVAGQDNDSQGFRDNFTIIKTGLGTAATEITTLQTTSAVLNAANTFSGNNQISANVLQQTEAFYNGGTLSGNTNVSFSNGHYQAFTIGADKINELQRKYFMTSNPQVHEQISSLLDMYIAEAHGRRAVSMQKDMDNSQSGLDKLINVS